ncbi:LacI family DNA-binding transcriptional regulator [Marinicrinis lubricantis]|uniref:LacI family DNA-binding transcriptional regulator n=1 Tax=Marinicrinis lubricantis TaxID=2086470 RepID=A0ABW1ITL2_9BACL
MSLTVTILDVAKACNVSKSTVSLVINQSSAVKEETRKKVLEAIQRLGYVPNLAARELQTKRKNLIGVVYLADGPFEKPNGFEAVTDTLFYDTYSGISAYLNNSEYGLLNERFSALNGEEEMPALIKNNRVDGVILIGGLFNAAFIRRIRERGLPAVLVGRSVRGLDSIAPHVSQAIYLGTKHLLETGHRRIVFINGPAGMPIARKKQEGFVQAMMEQGIAVDAKSMRHADYTGMAGYLAMQDIWESGARPDAVLAASDGIAVGAMRYLYEQKVRIPDDISVMGYEQSIISEHAIPSLTTLDINKQRMGEEACKLLMKRINKPAFKPVNLILEPSLVLRNSVTRRGTMTGKDESER